MSRNLKDMRQALGLTQEQMARELQCSINTVRRCEYDGRLPKNEAVLGNLRRILAAAGLETDPQILT